MTDNTTGSHSATSEERLEALASADPADAPDLAEDLADELADELAESDTPQRETPGEES